MWLNIVFLDNDWYVDEGLVDEGLVDEGSGFSVRRGIDVRFYLDHR